MARELHDLIAQSVGGMVVQAAAAETVFASDPVRSRPALAAVQEAGRAAITELRRMLHMLRTDERSDEPSTSADAPPSAPRPRLPVVWLRRLDIAIALGCFTVAELTMLTNPDFGPGERLASTLLVAPATLPLLFRRRFPVATLLTIVAAVTTQELVTTWDGPPELPHPAPTTYETPAALSIAGLVGVYSVAENAPLRRALAVTAATVLVSLAADAVIMDRFGGLEVLLVFSFFAAFAFVPGRAVRLHRRQSERLRTLAKRLERERQARARLAIIEERARLARELHDAIAHGVSVMVLQAGAAERVLTSSPDQAREAARAVQDTGRAVLDELRRLLGVLGSDEQGRSEGARQSLGRLHELLTQVRHAGLPVKLRVDGRPAELPAGMDASAYRVIQEGLTNALKHSGNAPTTVTLRYGPHALTVEVVNEGHDASTPVAHDASTPVVHQSGHGLIGMRERVAVYGGDLDAGPLPAGGFAVCARLPLGDDAA